MKKYFAKYLPSKGDVQKGDTAKIKEGYIKQVPTEYLIFEVKDIKEELPSGQKYLINLEKGVICHIEHAEKIKLFLCSRDIQIGDKVQHDIGESICETEDQRQFYLSRDYFKIIGEISPEAAWVKEGDEFDEDEVELWAVFDRKGDYPDFEKCLLDVYLKNKDKRPGLFKGVFRCVQAKIKNPSCNHFH